MRHTKYDIRNTNCESRIGTGVTLVEMLIVVTIIGLLASMAISIAARVDNKAKEQLTENTIAILTTALGQFRDYKYQYKHTDYSDFDFPLDCNGFNDGELGTILSDASGTIILISPAGVYDSSYSGSEALYFFLSRVPESRKTLDKIDKSLLTNKGQDKQDMKLVIDGRVYPLLRVIDPWDKPLRYDYYNERAPDLVAMNKSRRNFPVITSAGPDRKFDTADDITSR